MSVGSSVMLDSHRLWISGAGPVAVISVLRARESRLR